MKITKSQLKQIIMKEMDEGLSDFVGNIKGKAMAGLKTLVDPFKDATDRELELDVMKNIIQKQVPEGTDLNDDEAEKLIDFLVAAFLKSPAMQKKYRGDKHYAMDLAVIALSDSSAGAPGPVAENKMKITKSQLKQLIKEELQKVLHEGGGMSRAEAFKQLKQEFPDWVPGDLKDAVLTTAVNLDPETSRVQARFQELIAPLKEGDE